MRKNDLEAREDRENVSWKDLSLSLKIAVGIAYFIGSLYLLIFISGFIQGIIGVE